MSIKRILVSMTALVGVVVLAAVYYTVVPSEPHNPPDERLHVYLLAGQSNMAGRAPFTDQQSGVMERCFLLNADDRWERAKNPLNRHSTINKGLGMQKLNPGYSFGPAMAAADRSVFIGLVVNARGGTSITDWSAESKAYQEALRRTQIARETGVLKGILWHQGEKDREDVDYLPKLKALVERFRRDLNLPNLPFVAGQVNKTIPLINDQIAQLPDEVPNTAFVPCAGLSTMDGWHFDAKSMKHLGKRYANKMQQLQSRP